MTTVDRPMLIQRIAQDLCRRSYPRLQMTLIVTATGLAGFLASFVLLHLGLDKMWLRYPLAVGISYAIFFLLLRLWIVYQQRSLVQDLIDASDCDPTDLLPKGRVSSRLASSDSANSSSWSDLLGGLDGDEWIAVIVLLVALLVGVLASVFIVYSAPALLGEVFLDAIVVAALRKRMIRVTEQHWSWAALRRTVIPFLVVGLAFSAAGGIIQKVRPDAKSIGGILHAERVER